MAQAFIIYLLALNKPIITFNAHYTLQWFSMPDMVALSNLLNSVLICVLNHWGGVMHIYTSVNYPSLVQIMACRLVGAKPLSGPMLEYCWFDLRKKLQWNLKRNSCIFTQENASENIVGKMAAFLSRGRLIKYNKNFIPHFQPTRLEHYCHNLQDLTYPTAWQPGASETAGWASWFGKSFLLNDISMVPVQDCSISSALAMMILQSCTKP